MGLIPNRGHWEYELFDTGSAVTFKQGSLVQFATDRTLSEYSGGEASFLGIAQSNSTASLPAGKVLVAIPTSGNCTFIADLMAGEAQSNVSLGQSVGITKSGNTVSVVTTAWTSTASRIAVVRGPILTSPTSRIELAFLDAGSVYASSASQAIA